MPNKLNLTQQMKHQLRAEMISQCKSFSADERDLASQKLVAHCQVLLTLANNIAVYNATRYELDLTSLINCCLALGKHLYQPIAYKDNKVMTFAGYHSNPKAIFSELSYAPQEQIEWYNLDLIFIPVTAVDKLGYRLGKGGGYYDATLAQTLTANADLIKVPLLCGIGFACQMVEVLPVESWDIKLDYYVSELGLIRFKD